MNATKLLQKLVVKEMSWLLTLNEQTRSTLQHLTKLLAKNSSLITSLTFYVNRTVQIQIVVNFFSPLGKLAGRAIYFTDVFSLFFYFYFFNGRLSSQRS